MSRTAGAVGHIPELGIVRRLAGGRTWIPIVGALLAGIVAINVVTLSLTASTGKLEQRATALEQQNSALRASLARQLSNGRVEAAALGLGMARPSAADYRYLDATPGAVALAAERATAAIESSGPVGLESEAGVAPAVTESSEPAVESALSTETEPAPPPPPPEVVEEAPAPQAPPPPVPNSAPPEPAAPVEGGLAIDPGTGG